MRRLEGKIWVNWVVGEDHYYNIPRYYEWDGDKDLIELVENIAVVRVTQNLFEHIANGMNEVPQEMLSSVDENAVMYTGSGYKTHLKHAFVISDGHRTLAVNIRNGIPIEKSHLRYADDERALEEVAHIKEEDAFDVTEEVKSHINYDKPYTLNIDDYIGLSRKERKMKEELFYVPICEDRDMALYLISEINEDVYHELLDKDANFREVLHTYYSLIKNEWSDRHRDLHDILSRNGILTMKVSERKVNN